MFGKTQISVSRYLLVTGYLAFFVVQIFCNAGSLRSPYAHELTHIKASGKGSVSHIKARQSPDHDKLNVLVNKKFHPENTLAVSYSFPSLLPVYISTPAVVIPVTHINLSALLTQSLRAPPATAVL